MHSRSKADDEDEIDRVVRDMTAGEPGQGFTARVLARTREGQRTGWLTRPRLAVAGAVAVLLVAVALWWPARVPDAVDVVVSRAPVPGRRVAEPTVALPPVRDEREVARVATARRSRAVRDTEVVRESAPVHTVVVAPLDPIAPIQPAALTTDAIQRTAVVVEPLIALPPLEVEPIAAPGARH